MDLREYLFRKNLKVKAFADSIEHNRSYINAIVSGYKKPGKSLAKIIEFATQGEVTAAELLQPKKNISGDDKKIVEDLRL